MPSRVFSIFQSHIGAIRIGTERNGIGTEGIFQSHIGAIRIVKHQTYLEMKIYNFNPTLVQLEWR